MLPVQQITNFAMSWGAVTKHTHSASSDTLQVLSLNDQLFIHQRLLCLHLVLTCMLLLGIVRDLLLKVILEAVTRCP